MRKVKPYRRWSWRETHVAYSFFEVGAIKFGEFRLKLHEGNPDAPPSPIYVDLRVIRSYPTALKWVVELFEFVIKKKKLRFDCYADVPTAATPIVAVLSQRTDTPMITPREPKTHGVIGNIDGVFQKGQTALVIDDVVTEADSKLEAIRTLEGNGLRVSDVLVLIDREQGGPEQLKKAGYTLHAPFKLSVLLEWYVVRDIISQALYDEVMTCLAVNK